MKNCWSKFSSSIIHQVDAIARTRHGAEGKDDDRGAEETSRVQRASSSRQSQNQTGTRSPTSRQTRFLRCRENLPNPTVRREDHKRETAAQNPPIGPRRPRTTGRARDATCAAVMP